MFRAWNQHFDPLDHRNSSPKPRFWTDAPNSWEPPAPKLDDSGTETPAIEAPNKILGYLSIQSAYEGEHTISATCLWLENERWPLFLNIAEALNFRVTRGDSFFSICADNVDQQGARFSVYAAVSEAISTPRGATLGLTPRDIYLETVGMAPEGPEEALRGTQ